MKEKEILLKRFLHFWEKEVNIVKNELQITNHDFLIYKDDNNEVKVNVLLINNDIWLTQNLIAELFGVSKSTIIKHINNILNSWELVESNTVGNSAESFEEKEIWTWYDFAVDYRVNSKMVIFDGYENA